MNRLPGKFGSLPGDWEIVPLYQETPGNNRRVGRSAVILAFIIMATDMNIPSCNLIG